jgi:PGF-CTERM protein/surface glycoprotein (TIGR04207 family)
VLDPTGTIIMTGNNKVRSIVLAALVVFSVFAGSIALAGGAAAQADNSLDNGDVVFVGQVVDFTGADGAEGYTLVDNDGDFVREYNSNSFEIDTEELETGSYELRAQGADDTVEFTVAEQDLDAEFEDNELVLDSNRGSYTVEVTSSDADVTEVFSGATETDDGVEFDVPGDGAIEANESALESGEYDFDVQVTDTNANDTATLGVGVTPDADAEFEQSVYEGTRGDVVEIAIDFTGDAEDATVTLGSEDVNYQVDLLVEDTDGDGNATIVFNTYNTLEGQSTAFSADEGADVTVQGDEQKLSSILSADAAYDLSASVDDDETDVATLAINEGSIDSFEIGTAPAAAFGDAETVSDVENVSTTTDTIAAGDVVTHRLEATGIFGAVTAAGDLPTFLSQTDAEIVISEVDAGPNADADSISLEDAPSSAYNVVTDGEGVVYVNVDSSALGDDFETGQELIVDLTLTEDTNLVEEETTLNDTFTLVDRTASFDTEEVDDTDTIVVRAEENATITGETSVAPGTEFNVRVRSTGDNPFLLDDDVEATEDGTFEAEFDFSDVSANTTFEASIIGGNFDEADTDVAGVVEPARTAEVSIDDQETDGSTVTVASATLSEGGFVTIHDSTLNDGEVLSSVRGTSDYLESGENSDIEISLDTPYNESGTAIAMAHQDTNDNEEYDFLTSNGSDDGPYTEDGSPVVDTAELNVSNMSQNGTASVTIEDQETDGSTVTVASASLPEGGFVTIHDSTLQDGAVIESVRGTSEYLEAGNVSDLSITLDTPYNESGTAIAMPHMDTNDNQEYDFVTSEGSDDGPYTTSDGAPLTDSAELTVGTGTGNETTEVTETTTAPETTEETTMAEGTPTTDDGTATSEDGPGFGIVVALVALVAAALLAVRRDN